MDQVSKRRHDSSYDVSGDVNYSDYTKGFPNRSGSQQLPVRTGSHDDSAQHARYTPKKQKISAHDKVRNDVSASSSQERTFSWRCRL